MDIGLVRRVAVVGRALVGLLLLGVIFCAAAITWLNTESGESWVAERAMRRVDGLEIGDVEGFLPFEIRMERVRYTGDQGRRTVTARRVYANPDLGALILRRIQLDELRIVDPRVLVSPGPTEGPLRLPDFQLQGWKIVVDDLLITDGEVVVGSGQDTMALVGLSLRASVRLEDGELAMQIPLLRTEFMLADVAGALDGQAALQVHGERVKAGLKAKVQGLAPDKGPLPVVLWVQGTLRNLHVTVLVGEEGERVMTARLDGNVITGRYQLDASADGLDPSAVLAGLPEGQIDLTVTASGRGVPLEAGSRLEGRIASPGLTIEGEAVESLEARLTARGARWELTQLSARGLGASVRGRARGTTAQLRADLQLDAPSLGPLTVAGETLESSGTAELQIEYERKGDVVVEGSTYVRRLVYGERHLENLQARVQGRFDVGRRTAELSLRGTDVFELAGQKVSELRLDAEAGRDTLELEASAAPEGLKPLSLTAQLPLDRAEGISLAKQRPMELQLSSPALSVERLTRLFGVELPLKGDAEITAVVGGTPAVPQGTARIRLRRGEYQGLSQIYATMLIEGTPERTKASVEVAIPRRTIFETHATFSKPVTELVRGDPSHQSAALVAFLRSVRAERLAPLVPFLADVGGRISGRFDLEGTLTDPRMNVRIHLEKNDLTALLEARAPGERTRFSGRLLSDGETVARFHGSTPVQISDVIRGRSLRPLRFQAEGEIARMNLGRVAGLYAPLEPLTGHLQGDFMLSGRLAAPEGRAELIFRDAAWAGRRIGRVRADLASTPEVARVDASIAQERGDAKLEARLTDEGKLQATMVADSFDVGALHAGWADLPLARNYVSGRVAVKGSVLSDADRPIGHLTNPERITFSVDVERARFAMYLGQRKPAPREPTTLPVRRADEVLRSLPPFLLERLSMSDSKVLFVEPSLPNDPGILLRETAFTLENFASRQRLMDGAPAVLTFRALVETGELVGFATVDPLAEKPLAAAHTAIRGVALRSLNRFLRPYGLEAEEGTLSAYAEFKVVGNQISGGIKPIIRRPEVDPAESASFLEAIGVELADLWAEILGREPPGREGEQIATIIPIKGRISNPSAQLVPTVLGIVRNAFLVALSSGFTGLPPETAAEERSIFEQAAAALGGDYEPRAEPEEREG